MNSHYEPHKYEDSAFPIIFHTDMLSVGKCQPLKAPENTKVLINNSGTNWHEGVELLKILNGKVTVRLNEETLTACKGDIVAIGSNCLHGFTAMGGDALYHCLIINLELCKSWGLDVADTSFEPVFCDAEISDIFDCIASEVYGHRLRFKQMVTAKCLELMTMMMRKHTLNDAGLSKFSKKAALVRKMMTYISENYDGGLSLEKISAEFGYSVYYISHIFNDYTGTSLMDYILQIRLNTAELMLKSGDETVSEIAEKCGYGNVSSFSTLFKRKKGITPTEYRIRCRAGERA